MCAGTSQFTSYNWLLIVNRSLLIHQCSSCNHQMHYRPCFFVIGVESLLSKHAFWSELISAVVNCMLCDVLEILSPVSLQFLQILLAPLSS